MARVGVKYFQHLTQMGKGGLKSGSFSLRNTVGNYCPQEPHSPIYSHSLKLVFGNCCSTDH